MSYTPATEEVRAVYNQDEFGNPAGLNDPCPEFDRWLAEHDRQVAEKAWDDGLADGRDRWMDAREFGDKPVNPYRKGETE